LLKVEFVSNLPVAIIDNFYSEKSCEKIWQELLFLNNTDQKLVDPEETGSAWKIVEDQKIYTKKNKGIFLDGVYHNRNASNILTENRQIFDPALLEELISHHVFFRYLKESNRDQTLIQYYENSDYYEYHYDRALITAVSWFNKKPKGFTGGEFVFENELTVECKHNRMIIFPSILSHAVNPVVVGENLKNQNYGRYSISQFYYINTR
jgi:hypothetical protein